MYSLTVNEEQYDKVVKVIRDIQNNKFEYDFNVLGLAAVLINYKVKREKSFYCAEFVKYVLEESKICSLPDIIKPEDFKEIDNLNVVYQGNKTAEQFLKDYAKNYQEALDESNEYLN